MQPSEWKWGAFGAIYKTSWPARFFHSSLRPAGVKTTILQKQTGAPDFLPVLPLILFFRVILKDENCWISEWCYLLWKILLKSCKVCKCNCTISVNIGCLLPIICIELIIVNVKFFFCVHYNIYFCVGSLTMPMKTGTPRSLDMK